MGLKREREMRGWRGESQQTSERKEEKVHITKHIHQLHPPSQLVHRGGWRVERNKNKRNKEDGETKENTGDGDFEQGDEERETDKKKEEKSSKDREMLQSSSSKISTLN